MHGRVCKLAGLEAVKDASRAGSPSRPEASPAAHSDEEGQLVDMNAEGPGMLQVQKRTRIQILGLQSLVSA